MNTDQAPTVPMTQAENGMPLQLGLPDFQDAGFLGASFVDTNQYQQKVALVLLTPPGATGYEAFLVTYGGRPISDIVMTGAESMAGGRVGAILNKDPQGTGFARGARGGWSTPTSVFAASNLAIGVGHLVSYVSLEKGGFGTESKWLSRIDDGDPIDNQMETDIDMNGMGLDNVQHLNAAVAGDGGIGQIAVSGGFDVSTGDVDVESGDIRTNTGVVSPVYYGGTVENPDESHYVVPNGKSYVDDLSADRINVDAQVYSGKGVRTFPVGVTFADIIPNEVTKASYVAQDGMEIPKPNCGGSGPGAVVDYSEAKLFASQVSQYSQAAPVTNVSAQVDYQVVPVLTPTPFTDGQSIVFPSTTVNSFSDVSVTAGTEASNMWNEISATNLGGDPASPYWVLNVKSYTWVNGPNGFVATPVASLGPAGEPVSVLVQTACYYQ